MALKDICYQEKETNGEGWEKLPPLRSFHWSAEEASGLFRITQQVRGQNTKNWPGPSYG